MDSVWVTLLQNIFGFAYNFMKIPINIMGIETNLLGILSIIFVLKLILFVFSRVFGTRNINSEITNQTWTEQLAKSQEKLKLNAMITNRRINANSNETLRWKDTPSGPRLIASYRRSEGSKPERRHFKTEYYTDNKSTKNVGKRKSNIPYYKSGTIKQKRKWYE